MHPPLKIGLFGMGLDACRPQFAGLKERLEGYLGRVAQNQTRPGRRVVNAGLVDHPDRASAAGRGESRGGRQVVVGLIDPEAVVLVLAEYR